MCLRHVEVVDQRLRHSCECGGEGCPDDPRRWRLSVEVVHVDGDAVRMRATLVGGVDRG